MRLILFTVLTLIGVTTFAQTNKSITAQIVDSSGVGVFAGNVIIRNAADSTIISGASFFDGDFLLENIQGDRVLMEVSSFGYHKYYRNIELSSMGITDSATTVWKKTLK